MVMRHQSRENAPGRRRKTNQQMSGVSSRRVRATTTPLSRHRRSCRYAKEFVIRVQDIAVVSVMLSLLLLMYDYKIQNCCNVRCSGTFQIQKVTNLEWLMLFITKSFF